MDETVLNEVASGGGGVLVGVLGTLGTLWLAFRKDRASLQTAVQEAAKGLIADLRADADAAREHRERCEADLAALRAEHQALRLAFEEETGRPVLAYRPDQPRGGAPSDD